MLQVCKAVLLILHPGSPLELSAVQGMMEKPKSFLAALASVNPGHIPQWVLAEVTTIINQFFFSVETMKKTSTTVACLAHWVIAVVSLRWFRGVSQLSHTQSTVMASPPPASSGPSGPRTSEANTVPPSPVGVSSENSMVSKEGAESLEVELQKSRTKIAEQLGRVADLEEDKVNWMSTLVPPIPTKSKKRRPVGRSSDEVRRKKPNKEILNTACDGLVFDGRRWVPREGSTIEVNRSSLSFSVPNTPIETVGPETLSVDAVSANGVAMDQQLQVRDVDRCTSASNILLVKEVVPLDAGYDSSDFEDALEDVEVEAARHEKVTKAVIVTTRHRSLLATTGLVCGDVLLEFGSSTEATSCCRAMRHRLYKDNCIDIAFYCSQTYYLNDNLRRIYGSKSEAQTDANS